MNKTTIKRKQIEDGGGSLTVLTSPARIWRLDAGAYLMPSQGLLYYCGETDYSSVYVSDSILFVWDGVIGTTSYKFWGCLTRVGGYTYPVKYMYGNTSSISGVYYSKNILDILNRTINNAEFGVSLSSLSSSLSFNDATSLQNGIFLGIVSSLTPDKPDSLNLSSAVPVVLTSLNSINPGGYSTQQQGFHARQDLFIPCLNMHYYRIVEWYNNSFVPCDTIPGADTNGWVLLKNGSDAYIETSYAGLSAMVTNGSLTPGCLYRITDYVTKCVSTGNVVTSAEHSFDLVVTAMSKNTLSKRALAVQNASDVYFSSSGADLSKWEVWYDINNDTSLYPWADASNGKGVIFRLIDEFGNDCPYDFKNQLLNGYYTFSLTLDGGSTITDYSLNGNCCHHNTVGPLMGSLAPYPPTFKNTSSSDFCYGNHLGINCSSAVFGSGCVGNVLDGDNPYVSFGSHCLRNYVGFGTGYSSIADNSQEIEIGRNCYQIRFGNVYGLYGYNRNIKIESGSNYIQIYNTITGSSSNWLQNIEVKSVCSGTMNSPTVLDSVLRNNDFITSIGRNSNGTIKIYCEADFA